MWRRTAGLVTRPCLKETPAQLVDRVREQMEQMVRTSFLQNVKDWNNVISPKFQVFLLYTHECTYEALVAGQPGIERHLKKLGIGPGMTIYVAPAESRDYYLTRTTDGTDGRYYQTVYKDQRDPGVGKNAKSTAGIQWACGACAGVMTSEANMRGRILVLFSFENDDPEVELFRLDLKDFRNNLLFHQHRNDSSSLSKTTLLAKLTARRMPPKGLIITTRRPGGHAQGGQRPNPQAIFLVLKVIINFSRQQLYNGPVF